MDFNQLHFTSPHWLWGILLIPILSLYIFARHQRKFDKRHLEAFIDPHLLPFLLEPSQNNQSGLSKSLLLWSVALSLFFVALAGPKWNLKEIETFSKDQSLVILLDLSESMDVNDIPPSRLIRAKQKIEDILQLSKGLKIGLVAFASDAHIIVPVTDDVAAIHNLLPSIETDLVYIQGSKLSPALEMAERMLKMESGENKAILIISDGEFEDGSAFLATKKLTENGISIHTMGVGTPTGTILRDAKGRIRTKGEIPVVTKLDRDKLKEISKMGGGKYFEAVYSEEDETSLLGILESKASNELKKGKTFQIWDEGFYLMVLPILPILLLWFKRGHLFLFLFIFITPLLEANVGSYFKNSEQLGKCAFEEGNYETAAETFQDPYRKGVAYYKARQFVEAEEMFRQSILENRESSAQYNLGNALAMQKKFQEALTSYEKVLEKWPDHLKTKHNLEIVKKLLNEEAENQQTQNQKDENQQEDEKTDEQQAGKDGQGSNTTSNQQDGKPEGEDLLNESTSSKNSGNSHQSDLTSKTNHEQKKHEENDTSSQNAEIKQPNHEKKQTLSPETNLSQEHCQKQEPIKTSLKQSLNGNDKTQQDYDADLWLDQASQDPKMFLKNQFYIESKKQGTKVGIDPW